MRPTHTETETKWPPFYFSEDIFKCTFLNENVWILINISLRLLPKGQINNIPALVQIMAWCWSGDKPLSEPMMLAPCAGNSSVPGEFPHKGQWRRALMFSLICARINGWVNNGEAGDSRRHRAHYDVIVMTINYVNPAWCVATLCSQARCMYWEHLDHFHRVIYHLNWHKIVCMRYLACTFGQMKSINVFSMYLQKSGVPRHFLYRFIAVWT